MNYTAEDEILIQAKWDALAESCKKICKNEEDWNFIKRAFFLAKEAHQGVRRRSGEPYFLHPIAVAQIVVDEIGLGVKSVVASLLHDVVEDTDYTVEDIEHIFERFYRVDKSHSKDIGGTGLGLSIVKHGAKFHNAYVSIESEPGSGTTVRILF